MAKVTITIEDEGKLRNITVKMVADPPISKDAKKITPAQAAAVNILGALQKLGE